MSNIVREWYENKENVGEMAQWNKGKLKKWNSLLRRVFLNKHIFLM